MKILISIMSGSNNTERSVLRAFYDGVTNYYFKKYEVKDLQQLKEQFDIELILNYNQEIPVCDVGVQFGTVKERAADHHQTKQSLLKNAKTIVYIETPILGRVINNKNNYEYYRVGVNGYLNNQGIFYRDIDLDSGRLKHLQRSEIVPLFPGWKEHQKGPILVLCQLPGDSSLRGQKMSEWLADTIQEIRARTPRPIKIRLHPAMSPKGRAEFFGEIHELILKNYQDISWSDGVSSSLSEDLAQAGICVAYTSGSSVDAILAGVPVIALDEGNFAWPISSHQIRDLFQPRCADKKEVNQWLMKLANSQWTKDEMLGGFVWGRIEPIINQVKS